MSEGANVQFVPVRELKPGIKNMNLQVMILEQIGDYHRTKEGMEVRTFKVADKSGSVHLCLFGENGQYLRPGDVCRILRGYCSLFKNYMTAYVGKGGDIKRVGEFCFPICEEPNVSEINFGLQAQQQQGPQFSQQAGPSFGPPPPMQHFPHPPQMGSAGSSSSHAHGPVPRGFSGDPRLLSANRNVPFLEHHS